MVTYDGPHAGLDGGSSVIYSGFEGTVGVALLSGGQARMLVQPVDQVNFIDVAEDLLTDPRTRPGDPRWAMPPADRWLPILGLLVILAVVVAVWVLANRRPHPRLTPTAADPDRS